MENCPKSLNISTSEVVRRLLGDIFVLVQGIQFAAKEKHAGEPNERGGDATTGKDENHVRYDKDDQSKKQNAREQQLVGQ